MTTATPVDPFAGSQPEAPAPAGAQDTYDPFGDSQPEDRTYDGPLLPFPQIADLDKHLIALEPLSYRDDAPRKAEYGGGTQEEFEVRLTVLAGSPIELAEGEKNDAGTWIPNGKFTVVGTPGDDLAWPATWGKFTIRQAALIGQLKGKWDVGASEPKDGGVLLGVLRKCQSKTTPKHLTTPDQIDAALVAYGQALAAGRNATEVKFAWKLTNYTDEQKQIALAWYRNRKTN